MRLIYVLAASVLCSACLPLSPDLSPPAPPQPVVPAAANAPITIQGTTSEVGFIVVRITQGGSTTEERFPTSAVDWTYDVDFGAFQNRFETEDQYTLEFFAQDGVENQSASAGTFDIIYETVPPPPPAPAFPVRDENANRVQAEFQWTQAADTGATVDSGVDRYRVEMLDQTGTTVLYTREFDAASAGTPPAHIFEDPVPPIDFYEWRVTTFDLAGNSSISTNEQFVYATSSDVDGDRYPDFVVGAPEADGAQADSGKVLLYLGAATFDSSTPIVFDGTTTGGEYGFSARVVPDLDGDLVSDIVVGEPGSERVHIIFGSTARDFSTTATLTSGLALSRFGHSLTAGEVDGVRPAELFVGAPEAGGAQDDGIVLGYQGRPKAEWPAAIGDMTRIWRITSELNSGDRFGESIALAGRFRAGADVDIIVGASGDATAQGRAYVISLSATPPQTRAFDTGTNLILPGVTPANSQAYGSSISVGDLNADGVPDLVIGAPGVPASGLEGRVFVHLGAATPTECEVTNGSAQEDGWGASVSVLSGSTFVIGAPRLTATNDGQVQLHELVEGGTCTFATPANGDSLSTGGGERLGSSVTGIDLDLDGQGEVISGAEGFNSDEGRIYVYDVTVGATLQLTPMGTPFVPIAEAGARAGASVGGVAP